LSARALVEGLLSQEMVDDYDPALMFTIPRLAIVSGLLFYPYMSPLSLDQNATNMSDMFRPFRVSIITTRFLEKLMKPMLLIVHHII